MQCSLFSLNDKPLLQKWKQFAKEEHTTQYKETEHGKMTLAQAQQKATPYVQHGLKEATTFDHSPVAHFLRRHASGMYKDLKARLAPGTSRCPSFINFGDAQVSRAHYDDYDNVVVMLVGRKTFYLSAPDKMRHPGRGQPHENLDATPADFERVVTLEAGDALWLPSGWWHYVETEPYSVSQCFWYDPPGGP